MSEPTRPETQSIYVTVATEKDGAALAAFYRKGYGDADRGAGRNAVAANSPFPASEPAPTVVVYAGDEIVGHLGSIPTEFWALGRAVPAHWLKGFLVLESNRNGPLGFMLAKEMTRRVGLSGSMVVARPARRLFEALGYKDMGAVPNFVAVTRPVHVLRTFDPARLGIDSLPKVVQLGLRAAKFPMFALLAGAAVQGGASLLETAQLLGSGLKSQVDSRPPEGPQIDRLWERLREKLSLAPSRSSAYVRWRYAQGVGRYEFICVRRRGQLVALAVVRRPERVDDPRLAGLRVGLVVDLIADPSDTKSVLAALAAARRWGNGAECDAVLLTISHRDIGRLAQRLGYARIGGNVHFLLRIPAGAVEAPQGIERTWLTRGDAWGDDI